MNKQILIYSQYSKESMKLFQVFKKYNIDTSNMSLLKVDNEVIREKILADQRLNIRYVPTLIFVKDPKKGVIEKYVGFDKISQLIEIPAQPPQPVQQPPQPVQTEKLSEVQIEQPIPIVSPNTETIQNNSTESPLSQPDINPDIMSREMSTEMNSVSLQSNINISNNITTEKKESNLPVKNKNPVSDLATKMRQEREALDNEINKTNKP